MVEWGENLLHISILGWSDEIYKIHSNLDIANKSVRSFLFTISKSLYRGSLYQGLSVSLWYLRMLHISCIIILKCTFSFYCASYLFLRRKIFNLLLRKITFDFCSAIWIRKSVNDFHVTLFNSFSLSHDFSCCEAIKCQHTIFRILIYF